MNDRLERLDSQKHPKAVKRETESSKMSKRPCVDHETSFGRLLTKNYFVGFYARKAKTANDALVKTMTAFFFVLLFLSH